MKRALLTLGLILLLTTAGFCAEGEIVQVEVKPDVATWQLDTVKLLAFTETGIVTYRKVDAAGVGVGEERAILFMNAEDDPETVEDETSTDFTDFINYITTRIRANDSLKTAITKAVKIKLGI